ELFRAGDSRGSGALGLCRRGCIVSAMRKRTLTWALAGAAVGFIIWSLIGQSMVSALFSCLGGPFSCQADVEAALSKFVRMQFYGALGGGVLAPLGAWLLSRPKAEKAEAPGPGPGTPG